MRWLFVRYGRSMLKPGGQWGSPNLARFIKMQNVTNYVPTATITINKAGYAKWLANAKTRNQHNSVRAKRIAVMVQCNGQTVSQFYAACRAKVSGTVSLKLIAYMVNHGIVTVTTSQGKPALVGNQLTKYNAYAATSSANAKAKT